MKTIVIDNVEYELVPLKKEVPKEPVAEKSILDDYEGIKEAQPQVFDWREELNKKRKILIENSVLKKIPRQDTELDKFGDLVVGEGISQDF